MSAMREVGLLGIFAELDATVEAIERLRAAGLREPLVFAPVPRHELEHALHEPESPVRVFTLVGALTGAAAGFALPIWASMAWPLVTGGKAIISIPAFVVIGFEMMILFGALGTVAGMFISARLPRARGELVYDPSFSAGNFGIFVQPPDDRFDEIRDVLVTSGAVTVREHPKEVTVGP
jgi:hypothetical protein